jgi:antitoxin component YwqK of YwqJK toxin-antitoxin module
MTRKSLTVIGLLLFILVSCGQTNKPQDKLNDKEAEILITNFSKSVFSREIINSEAILDTLKTLSDTIYADTAIYFRKPKATIYANNAARTYFQVFENPKGTISAITFYKNKTRINVSEYFDNGQIMCKFNVTHDGVRDGNFFCFYRNGKFRRTGYYQNGTEIIDSSRTYKEE